MPKKNRISIYEYLFKEGVMVAKKDFHAPKHPELDNIPNLQVIKAMQVIIVIYYCEITLDWIFCSMHLWKSYFTNIYFSLPVSEISWLCEWTICMETFLLVPYQWRHWVPQKLSSSTSRGNCVFQCFWYLCGVIYFNLDPYHSANDKHICPVK